MNEKVSTGTSTRYSTMSACLVILFLNGCAVMNTSVMETAEPLNPGAIRIGAELFIGPELGNDMFFEDTYQDSVLQMPATGTSIGLGVTKNLELCGKLWLSNLSAGIRGQAKYRLPSPIAAIQWAILPGFNHAGSFEVGGKSEYAITGADIPIVVSWGSESRALYMAARYSIDTLSRDFGNESVMLKRVGILAGFSLRIWKVYIRPEIGYENVIGYNGIRTGGLGFGLEDMQLF